MRIETLRLLVREFTEEDGEALDAASCRPENAVMVGDRLDNDIRPAKRLGMRTVRIRKGIAGYAGPAGPEEVPDYSVDSLSELLRVL